MADLAISRRAVAGLPVVDLTGEVDTYNAPKLRDFLSETIADGNANLVLNLSGVGFIDSTGLGTLVGALKDAQASGGGIRLICPDESIYKMFTMTGLVRVFPIFASEAQAFGTAGERS